MTAKSWCGDAAAAISAANRKTYIEITIETQLSQCREPSKKASPLCADCHKYSRELAVVAVDSGRF
jgi:hypothetical protein